MSKIVVVDNRLKSGCSTNCGECRKCDETHWCNSHYYAEVERLKELLQGQCAWGSGCPEDCGECAYCRIGREPDQG